VVLQVAAAQLLEGLDAEAGALAGALAAAQRVGLSEGGLTAAALRRRVRALTAGGPSGPLGAPPPCSHPSPNALRSGLHPIPS